MFVPKWKMKAFIQKGISFFPHHEKLNHLFQKHITKGIALDDVHFGYKLGHAIDHVEFFKKHGAPNEQKIIMELGTGWYPIIPIFFFLTKTGKTTSIDIQSWMTKETQLTAIEKFLEWERVGKLDKKLLKIDDSKWKQLEHVIENKDDYTKEKINELIGLTLFLKDARKTDLEEKSIDFICSNNTFEHIDKTVLKGILSEFKRIIKRDGVMSHFIDMSDHFAHFDSSITLYNFLKYSKKRWSYIDNKIQPQNRMRWKWYTLLYKELDIPYMEEKVRPGDIEMVRKTKIHPEFSSLYSEEELAITHGYLVSKM